MTIRDFVDFILAPVLVLTYGTIVGFFVRISRKLNDHDTALTILVQQVTPPGQQSLRDTVNEIRNTVFPPGEKSLRALVTEIQIDQARQTAATIAQSPSPLNPPHS